MRDTVTGRGGFTLVEMLIVITLIALAVSFVYPSMSGLWERFSDHLKTADENRTEKKEAFLRFIKGEDDPQGTEKR